MLAVTVTADNDGQPGMEKGSYARDPVTNEFNANEFIDTNGEWGISHQNGRVNAIVSGGL